MLKSKLFWALTVISAAGICTGVATLVAQEAKPAAKEPVTAEQLRKRMMHEEYERLENVRRKYDMDIRNLRTKVHNVLSVSGSQPLNDPLNAQFISDVLVQQTRELMTLEDQKIDFELAVNEAKTAAKEGEEKVVKDALMKLERHQTRIDQKKKRIDSLRQQMQQLFAQAESVSDLLKEIERWEKGLGLIMDRMMVMRLEMEGVSLQQQDHSLQQLAGEVQELKQEVKRRSQKK
ncbi:hypothetical protein BH11PLA2_BH11PLA2_34740 [soil metagenome]